MCSYIKGVNKLVTIRDAPAFATYIYTHKYSLMYPHPAHLQWQCTAAVRSLLQAVSARARSRLTSLLH